MTTVSRPTFNLAAAVATFRNLRVSFNSLGITPVQKVLEFLIYVARIKYFGNADSSAHLLKNSTTTYPWIYVLISQTAAISVTVSVLILSILARYLRRKKGNPSNRKRIKSTRPIISTSMYKDNPNNDGKLRNWDRLRLPGIAYIVFPPYRTRFET